MRLIVDDGILRHKESMVVALALTVAGLALVEAGAQHASSLVGPSGAGKTTITHLDSEVVSSCRFRRRYQAAFSPASRALANSQNAS